MGTDTLSPAPRAVAEVLHATGIAVLEAEIARLTAVQTRLVEACWDWIQTQYPQADRAAFNAMIEALLA
jgi:hypothetical protein